MLQCFVNQDGHVNIKQYTLSSQKVMKKPTQMGDHPCKCTELSLK